MTIIKSEVLENSQREICFDALSKKIGFQVDPESYIKGLLMADFYKRRTNTDDSYTATYSVEGKDDQIVYISKSRAEELEDIVELIIGDDDPYCDENLLHLIRLMHIEPKSFILAVLG